MCDAYILCVFICTHILMMKKKQAKKFKEKKKKKEKRRNKCVKQGELKKCKKNFTD